MRGDDDERLLEAVADNHRVWFARCAAAAGAESVRLGDASIHLFREAVVFPAPGAVAGLDVDAVLATVRASDRTGVGCWSQGEDHRLGTRLLARGFGWGWQPHWMALALGGLSEEPAPARFDIEAAGPPYARTLPYAHADPVPREAVHLGVRLREKLVGQVTVNPHGAVAGIYDMGVVPKVRRRGIGLALLRAACRAAHERGCRHAVLNATEEGALLYRRAGFRSLGWGQTWWWFPRPPATERQIALAEAIGFGDEAALAELRPTRAELRDPLPCEETPLGLALLTDQPAVAEELVRRGGRGLLAFGHLADGQTLLHMAVRYERPAFVELALALGVDPDHRDDTFHATALGWAEHLGRSELVARLARVGASR